MCQQALAFFNTKPRFSGGNRAAVRLKFSLRRPSTLTGLPMKRNPRAHSTGTSQGIAVPGNRATGQLAHCLRKRRRDSMTLSGGVLAGNRNMKWLLERSAAIARDRNDATHSQQLLCDWPGKLFSGKDRSFGCGSWQ